MFVQLAADPLDTDSGPASGQSSERLLSTSGAGHPWCVLESSYHSEALASIQPHVALLRSLQIIGEAPTLGWALDEWLWLHL